MASAAPPTGGTEWISEVKAETMIELNLGVSSERSAQLLQDAVRSNEVTTDGPEPVSTETILGDMNIFPGGFTAVDAEYDERLGEALQPKYFRADIERLIVSLQTSAPEQVRHDTRTSPPKSAEVTSLWKGYVDSFTPPEKPTQEERKAWGEQHGIQTSTIKELSKDRSLTPDYWRKGGRPKTH